jgi:hypothetical protein
MWFPLEMGFSRTVAMSGKGKKAKAWLTISFDG